MIQRTAATLGSLRRLERHRLHFYNWYDTRTLRPLLPLYVSSVDSGNLAGHLLTLASGLREQADAPIFTAAILLGLGDTLRITRSLSAAHPAMDRLEELLRTRPTTLAAAEALLAEVTDHASALTAAAGLVPGEGLEWAQRLVRQCRDHHAELAALLPGLTNHRTDPMAWTSPKPPPSGAAGDLPVSTSLRELMKEGPDGGAAPGRQFLATLEALAVDAEDMAANAGRNRCHVRVDLRIVGQSWMRYSARLIHARNGGTGGLWQPEPFDHIVRSSEQFAYMQQYIASNPEKACLRRGEFIYWNCHSGFVD
jgi:hypothetical protein